MVLSACCLEHSAFPTRPAFSGHKSHGIFLLPDWTSVTIQINANICMNDSGIYFPLIHSNYHCSLAASCQQTGLQLQEMNSKPVPDPGDVNSFQNVQGGVWNFFFFWQDLPGSHFAGIRKGCKIWP